MFSLSRVYYHVLIVVSPSPIAVSLTAYCILYTFCIPAIPPTVSSFTHYVILPPVVVEHQSCCGWLSPPAAYTRSSEHYICGLLW